MNLDDYQIVYRATFFDLGTSEFVDNVADLFCEVEGWDRRVDGLYGNVGRYLKIEGVSGSTASSQILWGAHLYRSEELPENSFIAVSGKEKLPAVAAILEIRPDMDPYQLYYIKFTYSMQYAKNVESLIKLNGWIDSQHIGREPVYLLLASTEKDRVPYLRYRGISSAGTTSVLKNQLHSSFRSTLASVTEKFREVPLADLPLYAGWYCTSYFTDMLDYEAKRV